MLIFLLSVDRKVGESLTKINFIEASKALTGIDLVDIKMMNSKKH